MVRTATLSRVIQSAADRGRAAATDRDLLRRFAENGDEQAFEMLVRRHTGLVLGVCRRVLANDQDAEDACQAVFVILARKAKLARWQPSIANWLFASARKVARDLRRAADRRAKREGRAAVPEAIDPVDRMTGRELLAVIDEELDRLPPIYREPLLLHFQAELSRDEIAARLGVPTGTVKIRLERGRKRLGAALTKRGVAFGASLLALMATSRAGASPPRLVDAVRAAVAGDVPPSVAALAEGVAVNGLVKKAALGLILAVAAAVGGFGFGEPRTTTTGPPSEKSTPAKEAAKGETEKPASKPEDVKTRTITGKVLDPDGKSVAGAELINFPMEGTPAAVGKTAADGTFSVTVKLEGNGSWLFPRVAGFATDQFLMPAINTPAEVTYKLRKDTPIRGRVLDTQGKPVAGAVLRVRHIQGFENDNLDQFLAGFQKRSGDGYPPPPKWSASFREDNRKPPGGDQVFASVTGPDGKFEITGVGPEREALVYLSGPGIADTQIEILTRAGFDPTPYNRETLEKLKSPYSELGYHPMLYPPDTAIVAEAEKPIHGVVTDSAIGKPRVDVVVRMREARNYRMPELTATTDKDGRYEIHGARKFQSYDVYVKRDPAAGFIGRTVKAKDTPAFEPVVANIPTTRGIVLTGKLLDDTSGEPVAGFVCVGVLVDNETAKTRPEFDSPDCYDFAEAEKGVYRTVVPPGPILVMAGVWATNDDKDQSFKYEQMKIDPAYPDYFDKRLSGFRSGSNTTTVMQGQWCKVLKLKPDETEVKFDIRFKRAARFTLKVQDPDGKPVSAVTATGNTARDWAQAERFAGDTVTVYELPTAKPRVVALLEPTRKLVGVIRLKGDEKEPVVVTVGPTARIKGKLVDANGKPLANVAVGINYKDRAINEIERQLHGEPRFGDKAAETNAAGEFTMDLIIPGEKFWVYGRRKDQFLEPPDRTPKFEAKAGAETDVGTVKLKGE
jgi:RNA polymerase sigma factor (sigma-70 family)